MITLPSNLVWATDDLAVAIVEGDQDTEVFVAGDGDNGIRVVWRAPEAWAQYDKQCPRCGGYGGLGIRQSDGSVQNWTCPHCRDGHQVWEVRWPTPMWGHDAIGHGPDPGRSARATLQVVPVVSFAADCRMDGSPHLCVDGSDIILFPDEMQIRLDPLPVVGRDFALVVRKVGADLTSHHSNPKGPT